MQAKDLRDDKKNRDAIRRLFPCMPIDSAETILEHGFQKGSGRVGRTTTLDEDQKVKLAVEAHIRHNFTPYEELLRESKYSDLAHDRRREMARAIIRPKVLEILAQWSPASSLDVAATPTSVMGAPALKVTTMVARSTSPIIGDAVTRTYFTRKSAQSTNEKSKEITALKIASTSPIIGDAVTRSYFTRQSAQSTNEKPEEITALKLASTSPIIGDAVTRSYFTRQSARSTSEKPVDKTAHEGSSHTRGSRWKAHKWNEDSSLIASATLGTSSLTTVQTAEEIRSSRKVSNVTMAAAIAQGHMPSSMHTNTSKQNLVRHRSPSSAHYPSLGESSTTRLTDIFTNTKEVIQESSQESTEAPSISVAQRGQISSAPSSSSGTSNRKRNRGGNEDSFSAKRPRHETAISPRYLVEGAFRHIDTELPSDAEFLPSDETTRLDVDFDAMHIDDMAEPRFRRTVVPSKNDELSARNTSEIHVSPDSPGGVPLSELDPSVTKLVSDLRREIRNRLLIGRPQKPKRESTPLPGYLECAIIGSIKLLLKGKQGKSLLDLKKWQDGEQKFSKLSKKRQYNVILAEFREYLLLGLMDHSLYLIKHYGSALTKKPGRRAKDKLEETVSTMVGLARKDYRMIQADPYHENRLSPERSWAAWQAFEFSKLGNPRGKQGLREVLRKRLQERSGDRGPSNETAFGKLDDEEEGESETPVQGIACNELSSLSRQLAHQPGSHHPVILSMVQTGQEPGLDRANYFVRSEKAHQSDKENDFANIQ